MSRPATLDHLADHRYIRLTTFRRSGEPVHTPVWHILDDGALYVHTGDRTGKAKRLRASGRAEIAPSDARGRPTGEPIRVIGTPHKVRPERFEAAFKERYGLQYRLARLFEGLRRKKVGEAILFRFVVDEAT